jgi:2-(1,2-epoxy-1,2-dihydrophenyl)acetyl-CoA isomerase
VVDYSLTDSVAEIVLNDPGKLNAVDEAALAELSAAFTRAADDGARAVILRGEGRAFCAGRDISHVDPVTDDAFGYLDAVVTPVLRQISEFPAPTFAVATGACLGVGLGLLVATDVVYVADTARIGSPFANLGATLDSGGHALFYERLGAHRTLDLIYTAELMTGAEAVALGLFSRTVPEAEVLEFTRERAARVAAGATGAFLASTQLIRRLRDERIGVTSAPAPITRKDSLPSSRSVGRSSGGRALLLAGQ